MALLIRFLLSMQMDRMAGDMAQELRRHKVVMVSLWPGHVRTELVDGFMNSGRFDNMEGMVNFFFFFYVRGREGGGF